MNFEVIRQTIRRTDSAPIIADSINYLTAKFRFSSDWAGLEKHVTFTLGTNVYDKTLDADDEIKADQGLNLTEGIWTIGIVGVEVVEGEMVERITADTVTVLVTMAGALGGEAFPEISGAFGEIILQSEADRVAAEAARVAAEEEREAFFAEAQTGINEAARVEAEELRVEAEAAREVAEGLRDTAEQARDAAEDLRASAESSRAFYAAYNASTSYILGNKVSYNGSSYIWNNSTPSTAGTQPPSSHWLLIASRGDDGLGGVSGVYVGSDPIPEGYNVQIDPDGDATDVVLQFSTMPTADADYLGVTALFTGTTGTYKNGGTYICVASADPTPVYSWSQIGSDLHAHANKAALDAVSGTNTGDQDVSGAISTHNTDAGAHAGIFGAVDEKIGKLIADYTYVNLLNTSDADYVAGKYVYPDDGVLYNSASYNTTGFINVLAGQRIFLSANFQGKRFVNIIRFVAAYNSEKVVVPNAGISSSSGAYYFDVPSGVSYVRFSYSSTYQQPMVEVDSVIGHSPNYVNYGEPSAPLSVIPSTSISFPPVIYVVAGTTITLYHRAINRYGLDDSVVLFDIQAASYANFKKTSRALVISGVSPGMHCAIISIYDKKGNLMLRKPFYIRVIVASTKTKKIVPIGDSLSNQKVWLAEMVKFNANISYVGGVAFSLADSAGTIRTGYCEGHSGWAAKYYYTLPSSTASGSSEINPFWDASLNSGAGGFSWNYYVAHTLSGISPDVVQIFLGTNDPDRNYSTNAGYVKSMVDAIRSSAPTIPILICIPQNPSYAVLPEYTPNIYGFASTIKTLLFGYKGVHYIDLNLYHDSEYNYQNGTEPVNSRSSITQPLIADGVHPQVAGYYQMADAMFGVFSGVIT